ncbi:hypothetical protein, partial [Sulfitobacter sp. HI0076]
PPHGQQLASVCPYFYGTCGPRKQHFEPYIFQPLTMKVDHEKSGFSLRKTNLFDRRTPHE